MFTMQGHAAQIETGGGERETSSEAEIRSMTRIAPPHNCLCSGYVLSLLSMAGFNQIIYGRFWVITEAELHKQKLM
jgi:hypothetical protein